MHPLARMKATLLRQGALLEACHPVSNMPRAKPAITHAAFDTWGLLVHRILNLSLPIHQPSQWAWARGGRASLATGEQLAWRLAGSRGPYHGRSRRRNVRSRVFVSCMGAGGRYMEPRAAGRWSRHGRSPARRSFTGAHGDSSGATMMARTRGYPTIHDPNFENVACIMAQNHTHKGAYMARSWSRTHGNAPILRPGCLKKRLSPCACHPSGCTACL